MDQGVHKKNPLFSYATSRIHVCDMTRFLFFSLVSFMDAVKGCTKEILVPMNGVCGTCLGEGAPKGATVRKCKTCRGTGEVMQRAMGIFQVCMCVYIYMYVCIYSSMCRRGVNSVDVYDVSRYWRGYAARHGHFPCVCVRVCKCIHVCI